MIKLIKELNEQAELIANYKTLLAQRDAEISKLTEIHEALLLDGNDDSTAPTWKLTGDKTEPIEAATCEICDTVTNDYEAHDDIIVCHKCTRTPEAVQPLDNTPAGS